MMLRVVIDRKTWLHSEGSGVTKLLRIDGKKCCIGFAAEAAGVPLSALFSRAALNFVHDSLPDSLQLLCRTTFSNNGFPGRPDTFNNAESIVCNNLYNSNDRLYDTEFQEQEIIRLGKNADIEFVFVGEARYTG